MRIKVNLNKWEYKLCSVRLPSGINQPVRRPHSPVIHESPVRIAANPNTISIVPNAWTKIHQICVQFLPAAPAICDRSDDRQDDARLDWNTSDSLHWLAATQFVWMAVVVKMMLDRWSRYMKSIDWRKRRVQAIYCKHCKRQTTTRTEGRATTATTVVVVAVTMVAVVRRINSVRDGIREWSILRNWLEMTQLA